MKFLFICNSRHTNGVIQVASWIESLIAALDDQNTIYILSPNNSSADIERKNVLVCGKDVFYYTVKEDSFENATSKVLDAEKPDVCIVFGTEYQFSLAAFMAAKKSYYLKHTIAFAQGFSSVCAKHYTEGLPQWLLHKRTIRDIFRNGGINMQLKKLNERAVIEKKILSLTQNMIGRTTMDYALLRNCNSDAEYFKCNDVLRPCYYSGKWEYEKCVKHTIFVSQYYYPLKGFHYLLEALAIVKNSFPDVKVIASGYNPIGDNIKKKSIKDNSYISYLRKLAKEFDVQECLHFVGELSAEEMREQYLNANVFVMPSTIENSPNSMAEAMYLGVPSVLADVGGVADFAVHAKEAFIYPSSATYLLAYYIIYIFSHPKNASEMAINGRNRATIEYNKEANMNRLTSVLKIVAEK